MTLVRLAPAAELRVNFKADGNSLNDAVAVAVPLDTSHSPEASQPPQATVDQIDKEFVPHVTVVSVGTLVNFPNKDQIRHQVYSFSPAMRFELPLYAGIPAKPLLLDRSGVVTLGCNIHDWMTGYIFVAESPWFAKSGADGVAAIEALPAGRYRLVVWHPRQNDVSSESSHEFTLLEDSKVAENIVLTLKPDFRPRRVPLGGGGGYR
ncbi:MAG: methylamine utilization protein [Gammaproteobacteria bacterium]|nr:methylamine utilization protein [Gammaproteobacteria bacterium]